MQHFRQRGLHARALARRQHHHVQIVHCHAFCRPAPGAAPPVRTEVRAETRLSRVASPARTSWRQNCRGSVSEGTVEELLEGLKTSEWLKICIMSGLSPNFRPDLNGPGQEGNGSILRAPSGFNGGQQVEREVLIWRIGHDALRKSLGSAVIAVV